MRRGFTLIELLAVIVILAIISLITVPIVVNIINDTKVEGRKKSAEAIAKAVLTSYLATSMKKVSNGTTEPITNQEVILNTLLDNVDSKGTNSIKSKDGVVCELSNDFILTCTYNGEEIIEPQKIYEHKYTGTIYRDGILGYSSGYIGKSISTPENIYCIVAGDYNLCDQTTYFMTNSLQECQGILDAAKVSDNLDPQMKALAQIAECKLEKRIAFPEYTTDLSDLTWGGVYLKHDVIDGIVTNGYICVEYQLNDNENTVCIKGGDSSYYGNENSGNVKILKDLESKGFSCSFSQSESECYMPDSGWGNLIARSDGSVIYGVCHVFANGESFCD